MFERELLHIRTRMEEIGQKSGRLHLNRPATLEQVANFENTLGLTLPDQFREFVLQVTSGCCVGDKPEIQLGPLFPEYNEGFRFRYGGGNWFLAAFPPQYVPYDECQYRMKGWYELNGHEKLETDVGLVFAVWGPYRLAVLVLSGEERGKVWHGSNYGDSVKPSGFFFVEAFNHMLDVTH